MGYLTQLYAPIKTMARKAGSLQNHLASAERCFALLDEAPEVPERASRATARPCVGSGRVSRRVLRLRPDRPVLEDVSFTVRPGTRVGIAGATGAGKTTLMSLLARFYDPAVRPDPAGRRGPPRLQAGRPAQPARDRAAGAGPVLDHDLRQHRLRPPRGHAGRRSRRPRRRRTSTTSSPRCPRAMRRRSANAAWASPAGSANGSRSRARS